MPIVTRLHFPSHLALVLSRGSTRLHLSPAAIGACSTVVTTLFLCATAAAQSSAEPTTAPQRDPETIAAQDTTEQNTSSGETRDGHNTKPSRKSKSTSKGTSDKTADNAQPPASQTPTGAAPSQADLDVQETLDSADTLDVTIHGERAKPITSEPTSTVTQRDLQERLPRSSPDALRYEPGVYVQQTAHSQASPFIRGRTGQQTVMLFDGIRLNTSTFRQGPNQYFFTVDSHTIHHIDVFRGGASTRWGSDAIGGVINAHPLEPRLDLMRDNWVVRPRAMMQYGSADSSFGQRFQLDTQITKNIRVLSGAGYRKVNDLRTAGAVVSPTTGEAPLVPAFKDDGVTQRGTHFNEVTGDVRAVFQLSNKTRLVTAVYLYRQFDAPRTDMCPPPYAPISECMQYDEQFRTLAYGKLDTSLGAVAEKLQVALSFQRQHERRTQSRPNSFVENGGRDDVDTYGISAVADTRKFAIGPTKTGITYGGDVYHDRIDSVAWMIFTDLPMVIPMTRGLYLAGSYYTHGGVFVAPTVDISEKWQGRLGARFAAASAHSPEDAQTGTKSVDQTWTALVGNAGVTYRPVQELGIALNLDRSFRAPNIDDLTSRQQTGPGFQFENADLKPESATTAELGFELQSAYLDTNIWLFRSTVTDAITRVPKSTSECPPNTPQCESSWSPIQLINAPGKSVVQGLEFAARAYLPANFSVSTSLSLTHGEMVNPQPRPEDPTREYEETVPMSRIPPLNGTLEMRWKPPSGPYAGAALRWAKEQTRLALSDTSDERIPQGGTPGFAVVDLRAGYRFRQQMVLAVVLENVFNSVYRYHGSSVNGPARGILINFETGL